MLSNDCDGDTAWRRVKKAGATRPFDAPSQSASLSLPHLSPSFPSKAAAFFIHHGLRLQGQCPHGRVRERRLTRSLFQRGNHFLPCPVPPERVTPAATDQALCSFPFPSHRYPLRTRLAPDENSFRRDSPLVPRVPVSPRPPPHQMAAVSSLPLTRCESHSGRSLPPTRFSTRARRVDLRC